MESRSPMKKSKYFLDTSFSIAFVIKNDQFHQKAVDLAFEIERTGSAIITTQAILLEIGNALAKKKYRQSALKVLRELRSDTKATVVGLDAELYDRAIELFASRMDKDWGLVDCISFIVMKEKGITKSLTTDEHFIQAGFRALLRED